MNATLCPCLWGYKTAASFSIYLNIFITDYYFPTMK